MRRDGQGVMGDRDKVANPCVVVATKLRGRGDGIELSRRKYAVSQNADGLDLKVAECVHLQPNEKAKPPAVCGSA